MLGLQASDIFLIDHREEPLTEFRDGDVIQAQQGRTIDVPEKFACDVAFPHPDTRRFGQNVELVLQRCDLFALLFDLFFGARECLSQ